MNVKMLSQLTKWPIISTLGWVWWGLIWTVGSRLYSQSIWKSTQSLRVPSITLVAGVPKQKAPVPKYINKYRRFNRPLPCSTLTLKAVFFQMALFIYSWSNAYYDKILWPSDVFRIIDIARFFMKKKSSIK